MSPIDIPQTKKILGLFYTRKIMKSTENVQLTVSMGKTKQNYNVTKH